MDTDDLNGLRQRLAVFAEERSWGPLHTPKNLALALTGEVGELAAELQWLTHEESLTLSSEKRAAVAAEIADALIYLVRLSDVLDIDPVAAAHEKTDLNASRFPRT